MTDATLPTDTVPHDGTDAAALAPIVRKNGDWSWASRPSRRGQKHSGAARASACSRHRTSGSSIVWRMADAATSSCPARGCIAGGPDHRLGDAVGVALGHTVASPASALLAAVVARRTLLSILFTQSKWLEMSLFPYAVILQVTPVVAIAPLIIIWVGDINLSLLICAWIVAFFPILSNTILGLNSADHNLRQPLPALRRHRAGRRCATCACRLPCPISWAD